MSSYVGRHAEYYDIFYADKPYAAEATFVHECLQQQSLAPVRRLLELACGTGGHAPHFEQLGYEVTATDYSEDMLACARRKAIEAGSRVAFDKQDMRALDVVGRPFDAAVCLFDSIGYVQTNEAIPLVMQGVHRHLHPGGMFVFEFWHAAAMLRSYAPTRVRRWSLPGCELVRISETDLDVARQLAHVTYTIYELRADGTYSSLKETQTNRYFLVQEMSGWLLASGFKPLHWYAGYTFDENVTGDTWHVIAVARSEKAGVR